MKKSEAPHSMALDLSIVGVCGSLDPQSKTLIALKLAMEGARATGATVTLIDLKEFQLPLLYASYQPPQGKENLKKLKDQFRTADGLLIATPEYHGSYSGALKNALDLLGFDEFEGKMVGLIGVAGGDLGATNALGHLRTVFRQLHCWVIPDQVSIANSYDAFNADGRLKDAHTAKRLSALGAEVAQFALLHNQKKLDEFMRRWEKAVSNPGGQEHTNS